MMDGTPLIPSRADAKRAADAEARARRALQARSERWAVEHMKRAEVLAAELTRDMPGAGADERLLVRLASREVALAERLADLEVQLAERACLLLSNPTTMLKITKALRDTAAINGAITRRIESLLATASALRLQRRMAAASGEKRSHLHAA